VKVQPTRPVGGDATRAASGDDVRVSARGRELSLQTEGTVDTAKVDRLKSAIESGSFRVDPRAIAERMVRGG
jgi:flagellar biosynthesis anti-sigma factor FlgM